MLSSVPINQTKDKRQAKVMIRYLLFYLAFIMVLSLASYCFDLLFYSLYAGPVSSYPDNALAYVLIYLIKGFYIFPCALLYNYFINNMAPPALWIKMVFAILFSFLMGFFINPSLSWGHYLGPHRELKNFVSFVFSGVIIELLRLAVVRLRYR